DEKDIIEVSAVDLKLLLSDTKKVIISEDSIRQALRLDDADSVDCLPNEEIFTELARMRYEKPSTKLTFYKAFSWTSGTIPRRSNKRRVPNIVEPEIRTIEEIVPMADRTIEEPLQAPTKGDVSNDAIKLMLFLYSLEGDARIWDNVSKTDDRIDKLADQISNLFKIVNKQVITPATAKAVEKTCVICGGAHAYYDCIATDSNQPSVCAATGSYNQVSLPNRASHPIPPPGFAPVQNNPISNIVPNPKGEMKAVATRSGFSCEGPTIPTNSPLEKVVERETEETTKKEHSNCQGSNAHIQPLVISIPILKLDVPRTQHKPNIPYPSILNDQKLCKKATNQMEKFFQIFHDLHFGISFADALLLMPKFDSTIKSLFTNKNKLFELAKVSLNENCSAMLLKKLPGKLGDPDFEVDPRVPLILGRSFLRTRHALIDVYREEITLRVNDESVTFNLNQTMRYSSTYDDNFVNRVDVIDIACEEYFQDVLNFQYNPKSSNPTLVSNPLIFESDFYPQDQEKTTFAYPYGTFAYRRMPFSLCNAPGHKILESRIKVDRAKVDVIAKLPHPTTVKGVRSFLGHAGFYRRFIQDFSKIARPMTHLLENETPFVFSKECVDAFDTLKKKLTEAPILAVPDWNLPFELMCDASDFAIDAVLGQRKTKHFQPIH
nr:reverse transcriptase domain-containing protein [Tanacetum cinerariifolium]